MASSHCNIALKAACESKIRLLKRMAKKVNLQRAEDAKGQTALHFAASKGCLDICKFLVEESGLDVNSPTKTSVTPMSYAALEGNVEAGADVNVHGYSGPTPLTEAVDDGLTDFVKVLPEAGADPNIPDQVAAARGQRELVEILFPKTKPILSQPVWSVNAIMRSPHIGPQDASSVEQRIVDLKSRGKEALGKEDYFTAMYFYSLVMEIAPLDATMFANRSLCFLRMQKGDRALEDARQCRMMRPGWSKGWYREGKALSFMEDYKGAADAFLKAQELDPKSAEITEALSRHPE